MQYYSDRSLNMDLLFEATGFATGVVTISGSGVGNASGGTSVGEEYVGYNEEMVVSCNMTQPFTGCPTGQLEFDMDPVFFDIAFDARCGRPCGSTRSDRENRIRGASPSPAAAADRRRRQPG